MMHMTHPYAKLGSWFGRPARQAAPSSRMHSRIDVRPPALWPSSIDWRGRLTRWIDGSAWWPARHRAGGRLGRARNEFIDSLQDLPEASAQPLAGRIARARSLRELWHLRSEVYGAVAVAITQSEAERRLAGLNRHFAVHTARSLLTPSAP